MVYNDLASLKRKLLHDFTPSYTAPEAPIQLQPDKKDNFHNLILGIDKKYSHDIG